VRAGLVEKPWQWSWSSAAAHTGQKETGLIELGDLFSIAGMSYDSWRRYLDSADKINFVQDIRKYTVTGRPLGRAAFIERLEKRFSRRLSALPIGRPNKG